MKDVTKNSPHIEMMSPGPVPPLSTKIKEDAEVAQIPLTSRSDTSQRLEGVTQLHAAAVNGDKQSLSRLLSGDHADLEFGDQFGRSPLMYCVLADRLECAEILLKAGAHVNLKDKGGRTALHWAAHKGNLKFMKLLLSRSADCREKDNEGQTALHLCTRHKLAKCMALLLRQLTPGEIDDQDKNKRTALHWASSFGNLEHVKMLIKQGSNIGIPDTEGKTPLHWAASSRDPDAVSCVLLILETTPSVINWQDYEGRTALHLAVADGNERVVTMLTSVEKSNVSALDNVFRTPLHWAAVLGHSKIVSILLKSAADSSASDSNGATALHYAAQNNFSETVSVFLKNECPDEADLEGRTAFMWAAGKGADDVIKVFLAHGVDIHQEDKTGDTALHAAALSGHSSTVQLLLSSGAKLEGMDQSKHTPLFRACEMGHMDVVQTLIEARAHVEILDQDGRSPLHWAALGGHAYICQMLIKYGVYPNIRDNSARSPLHCAAYGGFVNCMSALMEHGADPNSQDKEGMTCLHWACSKGHLDAVKLLVEYAAYPNHMEFTEDRYTPLDYALMGEHHEVSQYMIEQGALSITGIQDIAALKIQSAFKGYRVRKAFIERKKLLMKHEKLKKEAARKRAAEEGKKSEDQIVKKQDVVKDSSASVTSGLESPKDNQQEQQKNEPIDPSDTNNDEETKEIDTEANKSEFSRNEIMVTEGSSISQKEYEIKENDSFVLHTKEEEIGTETETKSSESSEEIENLNPSSPTEYESDQHTKEEEIGTETETKASESSEETVNLNPSSPTEYESSPLLSRSSSNISCVQNSETIEKVESVHISEISQEREKVVLIEKEQNFERKVKKEKKNILRNCGWSAPPQRSQTLSLSYAQLQQQKELTRHPSRISSAKQPLRKRFQQQKKHIQQPKQHTYLLQPQLVLIKQHNNLQFLRQIQAEQATIQAHRIKRQQAAILKQQKQSKDQLSVNTIPRCAATRRPKIAKPFKPASDKPVYEPPSLLDLQQEKTDLTKRPAGPTEVEKILLNKSQQQNVKLQERNRQQFYHMKVEAARRIQRAWRKYYSTKHLRALFQASDNMTKDHVRRKRLMATQQEWEKQIAALTIQLAWRKYYRRKLLRALHPNRRQLLMWDPEVIALKQQALVNYIYNETIHAPFWHPTLKCPNRPLWFRFIPSAAAISYNFAVDQYVPWVARMGAQPSFPESGLDETVGGYPRPHSHPPSSRAESVRSYKPISETSQDSDKRNTSKRATIVTSSAKKKS